MEEKQITISKLQLNAIVSHAVDVILSLSGETDIIASTVHASIIIKVADEVSEGAISSTDILNDLQELIKERAKEKITKILDNGLKATLKLKDNGN